MTWNDIGYNGSAIDLNGGFLNIFGSSPSLGSVTYDTVDRQWIAAGSSGAWASVDGTNWQQLSTEAGTQALYMNGRVIVATSSGYLVGYQPLPVYTTSPATGCDRCGCECRHKGQFRQFRRGPIAEGWNFANIALKDASDNPVAASVSVSGNSLVIAPTASLNYGSYTLTIPARAIESTEGNEANNAYTLDFTVSQPLAVTGTTPQAGQAGVDPASIRSLHLQPGDRRGNELQRH